MRPHSDALSEVLTGDFSFTVIADVFFGGDRTFKSLPMTDVDLRWDSESDLKSAATLTVDYPSVAGESLVPADYSSVLAPYGQQINLVGQVVAGGFSETIQLGRYRIFEDPSARDEYMDFLGRRTTVGSHVEVTLTDLLIGVQRWGFRFPQNPFFTNGWDELARLTGLPVVRNTADVTLSPTTAYEATEGGRLKAVQAIANLLGGVPYTNPTGAVTILPDDPGTTVAAKLRIGERGTVLSAETSITSENIYNCVVGNFEDAKRNPITSVAAIEDGPLAVDGEYGEYTKYVTDDNVKTQDAADAFVAAELKRVSTTQTYRVPIRCVVDPRLEFGDLVSFPDSASGDDAVGRIVSYRYGLDGYMDMDVDVTRTIGG